MSVCRENIFIGAKDEQIAGDAIKLFPVSVAPESIATRAGAEHRKVLVRFSAGKIEMLVGTQMLAKGHDFLMSHSRVVS